jgi:hypothetical protein
MSCSKNFEFLQSLMFGDVLFSTFTEIRQRTSFIIFEVNLCKNVAFVAVSWDPIASKS